MWSLSEVECICADAGPKLTLGEEQVVTLADGRHLVINEWTMSSHESSIAIVADLRSHSGCGKPLPRETMRAARVDRPASRG
jgi:hypothetical protein